jgi:hypothetical protein
MRTATKLLLSAVLALALSGTPAAADPGNVEFTKEKVGGGHCAEQYPCLVHFEGTSSLRVHVMGVEITISQCEDELHIRFFEDGTGEVLEYANNLGMACTRRICDGMGEDASETEWPVYAFAEQAPDEGHFEMELCYDTAGGGTGTHCTAEIHWETAPVVPHQYVFSADDTPCGAAELTAEWESEIVQGTGEQVVEIIHP